MDRMLMEQDRKLKGARTSTKEYDERIIKISKSKKMASLVRRAVSSMPRRLKKVAQSGGELLD